MRELRVVGRVAAAVLPEYSRLLAAVPPALGVYYVFAFRQDADLPLTTCFQDGTREEFELLAITQQFNKLFDEIPHGWNVILALRSRSGAGGELTKLPFIGGWYERPYTEALVLTIIS